MMGPLMFHQRSKCEIRDECMALLEKVGLADKASTYPSQLSGGQQQRIAIARSLAMHPKVILFDEVTSALDPELVDEVLRTIRDLSKEGMTMIIVTHEMQFARDVADRLLFLPDGRQLLGGGCECYLPSPSTWNQQAIDASHVWAGIWELVVLLTDQEMQKGHAAGLAA